MDWGFQKILMWESVGVDEDVGKEFECKEVPYEYENCALSAENDESSEPSVGDV